MKKIIKIAAIAAAIIVGKKIGENIISNNKIGNNNNVVNSEEK